MARIDKDNYYLNIAMESSRRGTCLRRNFGAVIVNNDQIISTGYTGAPRGVKNCCDLNHCLRAEKNVPRGTRYELCRSVHAEANAIIHAARKDMLGGTMYLCGIEADDSRIVSKAMPCSMCRRMIINAGLSRVVIRDDNQSFREYYVEDWIRSEEIVNNSGNDY
jgi:dCMP deaminase